MTILRRLAWSLIVLAATAPAMADNIPVERMPLNRILALPDSCTYAQALSALGGNGMAIVANVPRTKVSYRFVVDYKSETFGVTVGTGDCRIKIVDYARAIEPYCHYVPGITLSCPQDLMLAQ